MASVAPNQLAEIRAGTNGSVHAVLSAARPRQWSKNLLLLAGIIFAAKLDDGLRWIEAATAVLVYCAASSSAYLLNDVVDADRDRRHPVKGLRPVARGDVTPRAALAAAAALVAVAIVAAATLGISSVALLLAFLSLQLAYTLRLKHVVLIDGCAIAGLFVIRAAAGAVAVDVRISPWLLLCTALLSLFLALGKRRAELVLAGEDSPGWSVLSEYSLPLVDQLVTIVASATVISYSVYTFTARDSKAMMATIPFVLFGVFRYLLLIHRRGFGEEPESVLLGDVHIQATVVVWAATAALILSAGL